MGFRRTWGACFLAMLHHRCCETPKCKASRHLNVKDKGCWTGYVDLGVTNRHVALSPRKWMRSPENRVWRSKWRESALSQLDTGRGAHDGNQEGGAENWQENQDYIDTEEKGEQGLKKDGAPNILNVASSLWEEARKGSNGFDNLGSIIDVNKRKFSGVTRDWSMNEMRVVGDSFCRQSQEISCDRA